MGRRPDYQGVCTIINTNRRHRVCKYRGPAGDCVNRSSRWYGEMCSIVGKLCKDVETPNVKNLYAKFNVDEYVPKNYKIVEYGDKVLFHSINKNKDVEYIMDLYKESTYDLVKWALGKTIGDTHLFRGNVYKIVSIKRKVKSLKKKGKR
ncbi:MAG: hypothetical protein K5898_15435 [Ruminococcus sp.]|uniref:hypothetical protein n=1 Tax=Ruminococcus sp. TaxID=41978 RepID=UPI0025E4C878|nr:hypothetical protein [Ruminococcus sp.]MCR4796531.1 hypothetical protein [Ruminococcus sp.]